MNSNELFQELRNHFSQEDFSIIVPALQQEYLVWRTLHQDVIFQRCVNQLGNSASHWSPAAVSMLDLDLSDAIQFLESGLDDPLPQSWTSDNYVRAEGILIHGQRVTSLRDCGITSIELRKQAWPDFNWEDIFTRYLFESGQINESKLHDWKSVLTCLYGFISDKENFAKTISTILPINKSLTLLAHIFLSQPYSLKDQSRAFLKFASWLESEQRIQLITHLARLGRNQLSELLAEELMAQFSEQEFSSMNDQHKFESRYEMIKAVNNLEEKAIYKYLCGQFQESEVLLSSAKGYLEESANLISAHLSENAKAMNKFPLNNHDSEKITRNSTRESDISKEMFAGESEPTVSNDNSQKQIISELCLNPEEGMDEEYINQDNNDLKIIAEQLTTALNSGKHDCISKEIIQWSPEPLLTALNQQGLFHEIALLCEALRENRPGDAKSLKSVLQFQENLGYFSGALNTVMCLTALEPHELQWRRKAALLHEAMNNYQVALSEWESILELSAKEDGDLLAMIDVAMQVKEIEKAEIACKHLFETNQEDGRAWSAWGRISALKGNSNDAEMFFEKGRSSAPEFIPGWIWAAESELDRGNANGALELLRKGVSVNPNSFDLYYFMAEICGKTNKRLEAKSILDNTTYQKISSPKEAQEVTNILNELGEHDSALRFLKNVRQKWPLAPELAYAEACILDRRGEREAAIIAIETALLSENTNPKWLLDYLQWKIGEDEVILFEKSFTNLKEFSAVNEALTRLLEFEPEGVDSIWYKAVIDLKSGNYDSANMGFKELCKYSDGNPKLQWKVKAGIGLVALARQELETALAALEEAAQLNPESLGVLRNLAETQAQSGLIEKSLGTIKTLLEKSPSNLQDSLWAAELLLHLGNGSKALEMIKTTSSDNITRSDLMTRLAKIQHYVGLKKEASETIEKLLQMPSTDADDLLFAARTAHALGKDNLAALCLSKSSEVNEGEDFIQKLALAGIYYLSGDFEHSLLLLEACHSIMPHQVFLKALQSEILTAMKQDEVALQKLSEACNNQGNFVENGSMVKSILPVIDLLPEDWKNIIMDPSQIEVRLCKKLIAKNMIGAALDHALIALNLHPENSKLRLLSVRLEIEQLQFGEALKLIEDDAEISFQSEEEQSAKSEMQVLKAQILILSNEFEQAQMVLTKSEDDVSRLIDGKLCKVQLLAEIGYLRSAANELNSLEISDIDSSTRKKNAEISQLISSEEISEILPQHFYWLALAYYSCKEWANGFETLKKSLERNSNSPLGCFLMAKAILDAKAYEHIAKATGCKSHIAEEVKNDRDVLEKINRYVSEAANVVTSDALDRLKWQTNIYFAGQTAITTESFSKKYTSHEALFLSSNLWLQNNLPAALAVTQQFSENSNLKVNQAAMLFESDPEVGYMYAQNLITERPEDPISHALLAKYYEAKSELSLAAKEMELALAIWPDEEEWHTWAAHLNIETHQFENAIHHWERAIELTPNKIDYFWNLGEAYLASGQAKDAVGCFEKAFSIEKPDDPKNIITMAKAYLSAGENKKAQDLAASLIQEYPNSIDTYLLLSRIAEQNNDLTTAIANAQEAIQCNPKSVDAVLCLSRLIEKSESPSSALRLLEHFSSNGMKTTEVAIEKARLIGAAHGPNAALPALIQLAELAPESSEVFAHLAIVQNQLGMLADAEKSANQSLRLDGNQPDLYSMLGEMHRKEGQLDKAIHALTEAIRLDPKCVDHYLSLGQSYVDRREFSQAIWVFEQATKHDPKDPRPFYQAGIILREKKDYINSERMLRKAAELAPDDLMISRQLGAVITLNLVHRSQEARITS